MGWDFEMLRKGMLRPTQALGHITQCKLFTVFRVHGGGTCSSDMPKCRDGLSETLQFLVRPCPHQTKRDIGKAVNIRDKPFRSKVAKMDAAATIPVAIGITAGRVTTLVDITIIRIAFYVVRKDADL